MSITSLLRRLTLAIALVAGGGLLMPEPAEAAPHETVCKKKKRRSRRAKKARRVTARTIKRWQKKGLTDEKIVEKARARGYVATKKERRRLKRSRVRKSLIAALAAPKVTAAPVATGPQPIDINKTIDPDDIDFDSVAPPEGMDMRYADLHRAEKKNR